MYSFPVCLQLQRWFPKAAVMWEAFVLRWDWSTAEASLQGENCLTPFSFFKHAEVVCLFLLFFHFLPFTGFFPHCLQVHASPAVLSADLCTGPHVITRRPRYALARKDCVTPHPTPSNTSFFVSYLVCLFSKIYPRNLWSVAESQPETQQLQSCWGTGNPSRSRHQTQAFIYH